MVTIKSYVLFSLFLFFRICTIFSQSNSLEHSTIFQSKVDNPITVEVFELRDKIQFYATNRSFYSYKLTVRMKDIKNLRPVFATREYKISPGKNKLMTFMVKDKEQGFQYEYSYEYSIGLPSKIVDPKFPYLIPVKEGTQLTDACPRNLIIYRDCFTLEPGDSVYSMRKGRVVATPDLFYKSDRISANRSLEIVHKDGTVMIYENLNPDSIFVRNGEIVYPATPLGIINNRLELNVNLYSIELNRGIQKQQINYILNTDTTNGFTELMKLDRTVKHPKNTILSELTRREIKRLKKEPKISIANRTTEKIKLDYRNFKLKSLLFKMYNPTESQISVKVKNISK